MDAAMKIAVVLTAFDKMSDVIDKATGKGSKKLNDMKKNFMEGGGMLATGVAIVNGLSPAVKAFANLEEANTDLRASMMNGAGAIDKNFQGIADLAEKLGNDLPGTTADFYNLAQVMMNNGVKSESVLRGVGKAAAFLAVDMKMPYDAAGQFAARLKEATGVADEEMLGFMDTISRANSLGVGASEMQYAFSRSAGSLKTLGLQGLQASKDMTVLYATLIRGGMSGETAATSFNNIIQSVLDKKKFSKFNATAKTLGMGFQFFDKEGKFMGVENLVAQFDKMKDLSTTKKAMLVNALTGGGADGQALSSIINNGAAGYAKMRAEMAAKASLNDKVNLKLKTLNAMWEATTGTIENMLAAIGAGLAPVLKPIVDMIGKIAGTLQTWFKENPRLAQFISMVAALVGVFFTLLGAIKIIQGIRLAMQLLNITMKANPFILFASIAILVLGLIYSNWDRIKVFFSDLWGNVKKIFSAVWNWIKNLFLNYTPAGLIFKHWDKVKGFFSGMWNGVKGTFSRFWDWIKSAMGMVWNLITWPYRKAWQFLTGIGGSFFNAGKNIIQSIWNGIKTMVNKPIEAIKNMVGKIRRFLPFSPAKEGPLMDIHRIKLVETIAQSVRPNALVDKMRSVAKMAFNVMAGGQPGSALSAVPLGRSGGGNVSISITLHGGASPKDAKSVVDELERRFPQLMKRYQAQQTRTSL